MVERDGLWYNLWRKKHPTGPYRVLRRVVEVNYKVYMPDKWKRRAILHINMLKKWHQPEAMCLWTVGVDPDKEDDVPT